MLHHTSRRPRVLKTIINKYLNNTITPAELKRLEIWLQSPDNRAEFKRYVKLEHNLDKIYVPDQSHSFKDIESKIKLKEKKRRFQSYFKYAAILICLISVVSYTYFNLPSETATPVKEDWVKLKLNDGETKFIKPGESDFSNAENSLRSSENTLFYGDSINPETQKTVFNTLSVPKGKTFDLVLSDGTKVKLNAGSTLRYPTVFNRDSTHRQVYLNGEAYFDVSTRKEQPFIVNSENLNIEVKGTHFDLSAYETDRQAYAVLVEGAIEARDPESSDKIDVKPGYKVFSEKNKLRTKAVNVEKYTDWLDGKLLFLNDSFGVIQNKLERKFDVNIINKYSALNAISITAEFTHENIEEVLEVFKEYKDFNYHREGKRIVIEKPSKQ